MNANKVEKHKGRILIVDDTPANLRLLMNMLVEQGYTVHPASEGELALRFVQSTIPDLILLDIFMPGMDGFQVCERLKANEQSRDIPVIFISSADQVWDKVRAFTVGGVDYIVKPFQTEEVLARIETHLSLRNLQKSLEERVEVRTAELMETNDRLQAEIAERKQAEAALQESEKRYRALYRDNPSMFFTLDVTGKVVSVNEFGASQLGYTIDELEGQSVLKVFYQADQAAVTRQLQTCLQNPWQVYRWQFRKIRKDGSLLWVEEFARAVNSPDETIHVLVVCQDITERKQAEDELEQRVVERTHELAEANEQLKELDQLKDQFIMNVTHDLRTPLTNINLYLDLLQKRGAERLNSYLPILQHETRRLKRLIEDLLSLSRLEQGRTVFAYELHVLDSLLAEVLQVHAVQAANKGLQLIHEPNPDAPAVPVDYTQMMQVFTNLISNAVAYTPVNGRIECAVTVATSDQVAVVVSNTGPVIPPEDLPHLFERFYRGQTGLQSGETGTGLGLAICKEIVERHEGKIEVESQEGQETTFRVWLPLAHKQPK